MKPVKSVWRRPVAALALTGFLVSAAAGSAPPVARAEAADAAPVPPAGLQAHLESPPRSQTRAWVALGSGAALTLGSFWVARSADRAYDRYLAETDPARIEDPYQDAKRLDRISATMLLVGQSALALGLYWKFIHKPKSSHARALGLAPDVSPRYAGVALVVPLP